MSPSFLATGWLMESEIGNRGRDPSLTLEVGSGCCSDLDMLDLRCH